MSTSTALTLADRIVDQLGIRKRLSEAAMAQLRSRHEDIPELDGDFRAAVQAVLSEAIVHNNFVNELVDRTKE